MLWQRLFASWVPTRQPEAEAVAIAAMQRDVAQFSSGHLRRLDHEDADQRSWLRGRAGSICGEFVPRTGDLFGLPASGPDWQLLSEPLDRLAAFSADGGNPAARRREANSVVELFQRRGRERASRAALSEPSLCQIGMLMLTPQRCDA